MSDYTLMNPDHLKSETLTLMNELIPEQRKFAEKVHADAQRINGYVEDQYNDKDNDTIVLTREQARDMIVSLARIDANRWRYYGPYEFMLATYKRLLKDRRWFIAAKYLRFLKK